MRKGKKKREERDGVVLKKKKKRKIKTGFGLARISFAGKRRPVFSRQPGKANNSQLEKADQSAKSNRNRF